MDRPADRHQGEEPGDGGPFRPTVPPVPVARARALASDHRITISELTSGRADALEAMAELVALTDFAAVYLGLASSGVVDIPAGTAPLDS